MRFNGQTEARYEKIDLSLKLADDFFAKNTDILKYSIEENTFYLYKDGYYQPQADIAVDKFFMDNAHGEFEPINYLKYSPFQSFIKRYAAISQISQEQFNKQPVINFNNGIYNLDTGLFLEHKADYLSTLRVPYIYDSEAQCPDWLKFIQSSLENDNESILLLQEFMGYCLGKDNSFQKALFLLGQPGSGKGTILRLISKLVGEQNTSAVPLDDLKQKTSVSSLLNKLVNIEADVSVNAKDFEADFRKISGKDAITAKILFKDEFKFKPYCKLIIAGQELPRISDKTRGFYRRMLIINFNITFEGREDKKLDEKLEKEISGILNWAIEGRKRLYVNDKFTTTKIMEEYIEELKTENNPIETFVKECIGFHDSAKTSKHDLYEYYQKYCVANGNAHFSKPKFGKEFYRIVGTLTKKNYRDYSVDEKTPIWVNVFIRGKNEPVESKPEEQIDWSENGKVS